MTRSTMSPALRVRAPIAIVGDRSRRIDAEIEMLARQGQQVVLIAPSQPADASSVLRASAGRLLRDPHSFIRLIASTAASDRRQLTHLPRAAQCAETLRRTGVHHVHATGDRGAAVVASLVAALGGFTFSLTGSNAAEIDGLASGAIFVRSATSDVEEFLDLLDRHGAARLTAESEIASVDWQKIGVDSVGVRRISERADSVVAEVVIGEEGHRAFLKYHRGEADASRSPSVRARLEYDVLRSLRDSMKATEHEDGATVAFSVPRALLLDETHGALVIDRAVGAPADELMRVGKQERDSATLDHAVRRAGAWLRLMQLQTHSDTAAVAVLDAQVERAIADVALLSDPVLRRRSGDLRQRLRNLADEVRPYCNQVCGHHGDYWPGNVFVAAARTEVIDFEGFRDGLPLEDVAYFLVELELLFPRHRHHLPRLRKTFLDAYLDGAKLDEAALRLFTLTKALRLLGHGSVAGQPRLLRWWTSRTLRGIVLRHLA